MDGYLARRGERSDYTFVITRQLDTEVLQRRFGAPRERFQCEGVDVLVYGEAFDESPPLPWTPPM